MVSVSIAITCLCEIHVQANCWIQRKRLTRTVNSKRKKTMKIVTQKWLVTLFLICFSNCITSIISLIYQNEEHLETESDSSPTKQTLAHHNHNPKSDAKSSSFITSSHQHNASVKTISTLISASTGTNVATTTRTLFKRTLNAKQKTENVRKLGRFDELKNS